ncbi:UNVERIFIED_CONTAM: hypothetical protein Sangu_1751100 [Sesamum angustifolium]|uniref:Uncharacterized protein n=1 Tax=Sesamum angustifolium TaxID=2727405 RepID=A0AAW2M6D2_9LAMI
MVQIMLTLINSDSRVVLSDFSRLVFLLIIIFRPALHPSGLPTVWVTLLWTDACRQSVLDPDVRRTVFPTPHPPGISDFPWSPSPCSISTGRFLLDIPWLFSTVPLGFPVPRFATLA